MLVRRWGIFWRKMEGSLAAINKKVIASMILHNIIYEETRDLHSIDTVHTPNPEDGVASVPDGALVHSTLQSDGSVNHRLVSTSRPRVVSQSDCALEEVDSHTRGDTRTRCPHREKLRLHLIKMHAKRPFIRTV